MYKFQRYPETDIFYLYTKADILETYPEMDIDQTGLSSGFVE